jgi:hypothetical protein
MPFACGGHAKEAICPVMSVNLAEFSIRTFVEEISTDPVFNPRCRVLGTCDKTSMPAA